MDLGHWPIQTFHSCATFFAHERSKLNFGPIGQYKKSTIVIWIWATSPYKHSTHVIWFWPMAQVYDKDPKKNSNSCNKGLAHRAHETKGWCFEMEIRMKEIALTCRRKEFKIWHDWVLISKNRKKNPILTSNKLSIVTKISIIL